MWESELEKMAAVAGVRGDGRDAATSRRCESDERAAGRYRRPVTTGMAAMRV